MRLNSALLMLAVLAASPRAGAQTALTVPAIDVAIPGTAFNRGVRGQAIPSINQYRTNGINGTAMSLPISQGSSIRGVAGGLEADIYDWRTHNLDQRSTTLDYLRYARDYNANLVITTNIRGLTRLAPTPTSATAREYYDTSIATLTQTAADWVRYTNFIAPTYRQGDPIKGPQDQAIINSLVWSSAAQDDSHPTLPTAGEAALPKVQYWEIGNEPRVPVVNSYQVGNGYTFYTPNHTIDATHKYDYAERYASMSAAMKQVDPTIKVGPALQTVSAASEKELLNSILNRQSSGQYLPIDFIGYHPYQKLYDTENPTEIETRLQNIYSVHSGYAGNIRSMISAAGRDSNSIELIASEVNASNYTSNDKPFEAEMGHALGSVETVFSFARLGLHDAHYWLWPGDPWDQTKFPVYKAYEGLRDHMGDTLLSTYANGNARAYTTRDSKTGEMAVWGLNFSNSANLSLQLSLTNLPADGYDAKLMTLKSTSGATTLFSANLASYMPGGPTSEVDWVTTALAGADLSNYILAMPAATISVLVITPKPRFGDFNQDGFVNDRDLAVWKAGFKKVGNATHLEGDADGDRDVDGADFLTWQRQGASRFGMSGEAATQSVAEPMTCSLAAGAAIVVVFASRGAANEAAEDLAR